MPRKLVARFPSLLEAEAAVTCLEAAGVKALVDNQVTGSMMPHASNALGGFLVSVEASDELEARGLLGGPDLEGDPVSPPATSPGREIDLQMKRAAYGAVLGTFFLPLIANLFSLALYFRVHRRDPAEFWKHKSLFFLGMAFNVLGLAFGLFFIFIAYRY